MRFLEILIPTLLAIHFLWTIFTHHPRPLAMKLIPPVALLLTLAHLAFEGYRWQMIPIYASVAMVFIFYIPRLSKSEPIEQTQSGWQITASILTLILLAISTIIPAILPVPRVADPSGSYTVGTQTFLITDTNRQELYSGRPEPRKFMIQVWYPAAPDSQVVHAPWMENADVFAPAIADFLELPSFFLDHLALSRSPAWLNTPPAPNGDGYPAILFSHGWNGFAAQNSAQMVELASHGYVVASMQHTYSALVTVFPDGEITYNNPNALPEGMPDPGYTDAARLLVEQWAGDLSSALDFLTDRSEDSSSPFHGLIDLTRIGVYGHSTGGGAAIQFCGTDARCTAGLTQDAFMTPVSQEVLDQGAKQPFFFLFSQAWADDLESKNNRLFHDFYSQLPSRAPVVTILGTRHYDFSDLPLLSPLAPQLGLKGPINGKLVVRILNEYLVAYFDQELKGIPSVIPFGPSAGYPDLRWEG